ncbi:MAG: DNA-directed RNA polymerase subunit N [Candidatus Nanoarchaeia archaeon]
MIPIRCYSCGKPIAHLWEEFKERAKNEDSGELMTELGMDRFCCRQIFLGHVELTDTAGKFKKF